MAVIEPSRPVADVAKTRFFYGMIALTAATKIWLILGFGMRAAGDAKADDRLFMVLADGILAGQWLGSYDHHTLVKGPFFSIWIVLSFLSHVPLLVSYQLLHLFACLLMVVALRPLMPRRTIQYALFLWLLFDPTMYSVMASWVVRASIYMPLTIMVLAGMFALVTRLDAGRRELSAWSIMLGATLAMFWTTREEGIWIVPGAMLALAYALVIIWMRRDDAIVKSAILMIPAAICASGVLAICTLNYISYDFFGMVEFKSSAFTRANGALMRVEHDDWNRFANVPQDVRMRVHDVSPAFAELQEFLEGPPGEAWGHGAEFWLDGGTPSPKDIRGGFFPWALRQAAAARGHHASASTATAYYDRVADEINAACDDGRLACGPASDSMTPPWRNEYIPLLLESLSLGLWKLITLDEVVVGELPSSGAVENQKIFADLGRARLTPEITGTESSNPLAHQARLDNYRFQALRILNECYKALIPIAVVCGVVAFVFAPIRTIRSRSVSPILVICVTLLACFSARMAILSFISVTSFEAMKMRYFTPIYPIVLLFIFLTIYHFGQTIALARQRARDARTEDHGPALDD